MAGRLWRAILGCGGLLAATTLGVPALSSVGAATASSSSDLVVTSPSAPFTVQPGTLFKTTLTVGNLGYSPLPVRIITEKVELLDNGRTRLLAEPDPLFAGRVTIFPDAMVLPARHESPVAIAIDVPAKLRPNDYFLGFLVSPVITAPTTTVENDIGSIVVLNVPGPRYRHLTASFEGPPAFNFTFSSGASGLLQATNTGAATLQYATTVETTGTPSPSPSYTTHRPALLAPGLSRQVGVSVSSWLGIGWYTFHATLVYGEDGGTSGQAVASRTVFILNPLWLLLPLFLVAAWYWRRRRKRRARGLPPSGRTDEVASRVREPLRRKETRTPVAAQ